MDSGFLILRKNHWKLIDTKQKHLRTNNYHSFWELTAVFEFPPLSSLDCAFRNSSSDVACSSHKSLTTVLANELASDLLRILKLQSALLVFILNLKITPTEICIWTQIPNTPLHPSTTIAWCFFGCRLSLDLVSSMRGELKQRNIPSHDDHPWVNVQNIAWKTNPHAFTSCLKNKIIQPSSFHSTTSNVLLYIIGTFFLHQTTKPPKTLATKIRNFQFATTGPPPQQNVQPTFSNQGP